MLCASLSGPTSAWAEATAPSPAADLVLTNGRVRTPSGWAEALAVRSGVIVAVGSAQSMVPLQGAATRVLDLRGATVLPGLHDVHVHPMYAGITELQCRIAQGSTLAQTQARVRECAQRAAAGEWVLGGQWDAPALGASPHRAALDKVSQSHPVFLEDTSGHSAWVNSRALALAGIDAHSKDPAGGIIERDRSGMPTGVLRESATDLVRSHIPPPTVAQLREALQRSLKTMLSFGITSYTEAAVGFVAGPERELAAYGELSGEPGLIKPRATLCITWTPGSTESERAIETRNLYARGRVDPSCVKIFLDGVPTDSHTAAMLEPYAGTADGRADHAARYGMLLVKQDILDEAVTRFDRMGLTVKFHAAGDAAVRAGLDAIAAARRANGYSGLMHNVGHCTFVAPEDIARARQIGATLEVSPYLWGPTPINDSIVAAVGPETIKRVWPVREMLDAGALVVPGSDWSVVPSVNPWIGIETLVTRAVPGGSTQTFGKAEAITLPEALALFTENAARQERAANRLGRIEPGLLADFIVLDRNPYEIRIEDVHDTKVAMTFINGELVYTAGAQAP
ncbi:MAG: amidohydrolase [Proteobacteria bacterium]|nr:amidohydrolase [Pseudomonadota bacterium]